ncbi:PP2C family protein-serine/threonine phosphatase [Streptomyces lasalocidi]
MRHHQLQPGDRLLLYTDGIVEARDAAGREFGRDRFVDFIVRHHSGRQTLHETLRRADARGREHHAGHLNDDATVLLVEWRAAHQDQLTPSPAARTAGPEPGFTPGPSDTRDEKSTWTGRMNQTSTGRTAGRRTAVTAEASNPIVIRDWLREGASLTRARHTDLRARWGTLSAGWDRPGPDMTSERRTDNGARRRRDRGTHDGPPGGRGDVRPGPGDAGRRAGTP